MWHPVRARALDRPWPVADRAVDGVRRPRSAAARWSWPRNVKRPWRVRPAHGGHHERTEAVRAAGVVGWREQEIDVTDLQAIHPAAVFGIDGDARLASLELDHPSTLRPKLLHLGAAVGPRVAAAAAARPAG